MGPQVLSPCHTVLSFLSIFHKFLVSFPMSMKVVCPGNTPGAKEPKGFPSPPQGDAPAEAQNPPAHYWFHLQWGSPPCGLSVTPSTMCIATNEAAHRSRCCLFLGHAPLPLERQLLLQRPLQCTKHILVSTFNCLFTHSILCLQPFLSEWLIMPVPYNLHIHTYT